MVRRHRKEPPTVPLGILCNALLGLCFAAAARRQLAHGRSPFGAELRAVLSFLAIVAAPVSLYFLLVHPDWSWLYFVDGAALPWWATTLALLVLGAALLGGYLGGSLLLRRRGERALLSACAGAAAAILLLLLVVHGRIFAYGTTAEFRRGAAASLFEVKLFWILGICAVGEGAAAAAVCLNLLSLGRPRNSRR